MTVPVGSCLQGWFPLKGFPWIPPCLSLKCSHPCQHLRHKFPSSSSGDEFKDKKKCCTVMLSANVRNNLADNYFFHTSSSVNSPARLFMSMSAFLHTMLAYLRPTPYNNIIIILGGHSSKSCVLFDNKVLSTIKSIFCEQI